VVGQKGTAQVTEAAVGEFIGGYPAG
jgi:hypothetical protein